MWPFLCGSVTGKALVADARQLAEEKTITVLVKPLLEQVRKTLDTLLRVWAYSLDLVRFKVFPRVMRTEKQCFRE
jgi:hypothetical protein